MSDKEKMLQYVNGAVRIFNSMCVDTDELVLVVSNEFYNLIKDDIKDGKLDTHFDGIEVKKTYMPVVLKVIPKNLEKVEHEKETNRFLWKFTKKGE